MPPSILLSLTIAVLYGSSWHVVFGRRLWQLPVYLLLSVAGFFAGYAGGVALGVEWLRLGSIPLLAASAGAFVGLVIGWYLVLPATPTLPRDAERDV